MFIYPHIADETHLSLSLFLEGQLINKIQLKGRYKKGYFSIRQHVEFDFKYGPIWTLFTKKMGVMLSKDNNLVLVTSSSNTVLLILFPIGGAGDKNIVNSFRRVN